MRGGLPKKKSAYGSCRPPEALHATSHAIRNNFKRSRASRFAATRYLSMSAATGESSADSGGIIIRLDELSNCRISRMRGYIFGKALRATSSGGRCGHIKPH